MPTPIEMSSAAGPEAEGPSTLGPSRADGPEAEGPTIIGMSIVEEPEAEGPSTNAIAHAEDPEAEAPESQMPGLVPERGDNAGSAAVDLRQSATQPDAEQGVQPPASQQLALDAAIDKERRGSLVVHVALSFTDIEFAVMEKRAPKQILHGISGTVNGGSMLCILGPSGCGKTSLIHIISHKIQNNATHKVNGAVRCNDQELTATKFQRISGLVTQEDIFNGALTVRETLSFAARLRLPSKLRSQCVSRVVEKLQLESCLNTKVGDDSNPYLKGISGGEKRRLAIAMEILDPEISVLVLDEPTSGLDAAAALIVTNLLRSLADTGIGIVTTLHQPRPSIMAQFNNLMVLSEGRRVFYGPLAEYVPYLKEGLQCDVPVYESPNDLLLDALNPALGQRSIPMGVIPGDCKNVPERLALVFADSALRGRMDKVDQAVRATGAAGCDLGKERAPVVGWWSQAGTILHRTFLIKTRDPLVMVTQLSTGAMMGLIFGTLYWQVYHDKAAQFALMDSQMACTMSVIMSLWLPMDVILTFPKERKIFLRERKAGLYSTSAFFVARITADMPLHIMAAVLMSAIIYPMAGLRMGFHLFCLINTGAVLIGATLLQAAGALSRTFEEANLVTMLVLMLSMMMSTGFVREVPSWLTWLREISVAGIISDMAMYLEYRDAEASLGTSEEIFEYYGIQLKTKSDVLNGVWILLVIFVCTRLGTFFAVKFLHTGRSCGENLWN